MVIVHVGPYHSTDAQYPYPKVSFKLNSRGVFRCNALNFPSFSGAVGVMPNPHELINVRTRQNGLQIGEIVVERQDFNPKPGSQINDLYIRCYRFKDKEVTETPILLAPIPIRKTADFGPEATALCENGWVVGLPNESSSNSYDGDVTAEECRSAVRKNKTLTGWMVVDTALKDLNAKTKCYYFTAFGAYAWVDHVAGSDELFMTCMKQVPSKQTIRVDEAGHKDGAEARPNKPLALLRLDARPASQETDEMAPRIVGSGCKSAATSGTGSDDNHHQQWCVPYNDPHQYLWISDLKPHSADPKYKYINLKAIRAFSQGGSCITTSDQHCGNLLLTPSNAMMSTTYPADVFNNINRTFSVDNCVAMVRSIEPWLRHDCHSGIEDKDPWIRLTYKGNPDSIRDAITSVLVHNTDNQQPTTWVGERILGATLRLTRDIEGTDEVWSRTFEDGASARASANVPEWYTLDKLQPDFVNNQDFYFEISQLHSSSTTTTSTTTSTTTTAPSTTTTSTAAPEITTKTSMTTVPDAVAATTTATTELTPTTAATDDAYSAQEGSGAGGWAGLGVGVVVVVAVMALLLVRRRRNRGPNADSSVFGDCFWAKRGRRERQLKEDLCAAVKERAALAFLAAYNRDLFAAIGSVEEFNALVATLEIPRAQLKTRGVLGTGNYGQVTIASCSSVAAGDGGGGDGGSTPQQSAVTQVAVKSRLPTENDATVDEALLIEALVLHALNHRHVLGLVGVCTSTLPFLIATELMVNGDLKSYLRASRPSQPKPKALICVLDVAVILERIASALAHLEAVLVIHRDIAARNILVGATVTDVKLGDLGAARSVFRLADRAYTATSDHNPARWMAPEALKTATFNNKTDMWSFGVLVWEISTLGKTPYGALGVRDMSLSINAGNRLDLGLVVQLSPSASFFLGGISRGH